jgi:hypothetical protein
LAAVRCLAPTPRITIYPTTVGIHAKLSYLTRCHLTDPDQKKKFKIPMDYFTAANCNLRGSQVNNVISVFSESTVLTTSEMTPMMTIPRVTSRWSDALASTWPPMMQFRIRNPWRQKTFNALGRMDP